MIVIAIMSIVAAIASLSWQRYVNNANLRTAARELVTDMANSKQKAVSEGVKYRMTITAGTPGSYTIEQRNAADTAYTVISTKSPTASGGGLFLNSNNIITFQPRGPNSTGTIVLKNSIGYTATITSNITGKTYVTFTQE